MKKLAVVLAFVAMPSVAGYRATPSAAAQIPSIDVPGEWLMAGQPDQPCAIFRQGAVLLIVNERGDLATGRTDVGGKLVVLKGVGWKSGVTATVLDNGRSLIWSDGSTWSRR